MTVSLGQLRQLSTRIGDITNMGPTLEPQRSYMFEAFFYGGDSSGETIQFQVKGINLPARGSELIVQEYYDQQLVFAGKKASNHTVTMTFWEDQTAKVQTFLHSWQDLIHYVSKNRNSNDDTSWGGGVEKRLHSKTLIVELKDTTDVFKTAQYEFTNTVLTDINEITLSYDSSEIMEVQAVFAFDKMKFKPGIDVSVDLETVQGILF